MKTVLANTSLLSTCLALAALALAPQPAQAQVDFNSVVSNPVRNPPVINGVITRDPIYATSFEDVPFDTNLSAGGFTVFDPYAGGGTSSWFTGPPMVRLDVTPDGTLDAQGSWSAASGSPIPVMATGPASAEAAAMAAGFITTNVAAFLHPSADFAVNPGSGGPPLSSMGSGFVQEITGDGRVVATLSTPATNLGAGKYSLSGRLATIGAFDATGESFNMQDILRTLGPTTDVGQFVGDNDFDVGPDTLTIRVNGMQIFRGTFDQTNQELLSVEMSPESTFQVLDFNTGDVTGFGRDSSVFPQQNNNNDNLFDFDLVFGSQTGGPFLFEFETSGGVIGALVNGNPQEEIFAFDDLVVQSAITPEPGSMILMGLGLCGAVGFGFWRRRRKQVA